MNEKVFNEKLNNCIKSKLITAYTIDSFFDSDNKSNFFSRVSIEELIMKNYEKIIENRLLGQLVPIIQEMYKHEGMREFIKEKMVYNMIQAYDFEFISFLYLEIGDINVLEIIENNIDYLLKKLSFKNILVIFKEKEFFSNNVKEKVNKILEQNKKKFIKGILTKKINDDNISEEDLNKVIDVLEKILDEVLENEEQRIIDISVSHSGLNSDVILVGDKVIKVSKKRKTYTIPYDERILVPLIRFDLKKISNIDAIIEVTERVKVESFSDEQLYSLYKDMRQRGVIFTDLTSANVGILLKDNVKHWKKGISSDLTNLGFDMTGKEVKVLKKGELVVLDSDYIFDEKEKRILCPRSNTKKYERRYLQEKALSKGIKADNSEIIDSEPKRNK